ncbi:hypothetical protein [Demequina soli]|uniref:hypothetical protein n=1 Tax=Demequina soli TaxID=1638987 RepID=UPI000784ED05|nr:hypothetical protein [Demequina soli]
MSTEVERVDLRTEARLFQVISTSSSVYYADARGDIPLPLRAAGDGNTEHGPWDDMWVPLSSLASGPPIVVDGRDLTDDEIDWSDWGEWELRVGTRHIYEWDVPGPGGVNRHEWVQRAATRIVALDEMPPEGARIRVEDDPDPDDGIPPMRWEMGP